MANQRSETLVKVGIFAGILFLVGAGLTGCRKPMPNNIPLPSDAKAQSSSLSVTPNLVIDVYVDGSGSMEHFLHDPNAPVAASSDTNYFRSLLDGIGLIGSQQVWQDHPPKFWLFGGDTLKPKNDVDLPHMADNPSRAIFSEQSTKIEVPFQVDPGADRVGRKKGSTEDDDPKAHPPELKVVITDLYESSQTMTELGKAVADKYLRDASQAVAILAIRNPFYGKVDDLPGNHTNKPTATSMPFYVILAGPVADVRTGVRILLDSVHLRNAFQDPKANAKLMYFSRSQGEFTPLLPVKVTPKPLDLRPLTTNYRGSDIPFYSLKARGKEPLRIVWTELPEYGWAAGDAKLQAGLKPESWSILPGQASQVVVKAVAFDPKDFAVARGGRSAAKASAESSDATDANASAKAAKAAADTAGQSAPEVMGAVGHVVCTDGGSCVSSTDGLKCPAAEGKTCVAVEIPGSILETGKVYRFEVDVISASADSFNKTSSAMKGWHIEKQAADDLGKTKNAKFPAIDEVLDKDSPGMTPDLANFLSALQGKMFPVQTPKHHYVYVQAK